MYLPAHFEEARPERLHALLRQFPLGLLVSLDGDGAPVANSIPMLLDAGRGPRGTLVAHVARANPVWQQAAGQTVLVVFQGPEGYVSPSSYPSKARHGKVVPTWNYAMVQARGVLQVMDAAALKHAIVSRLTERHEQARPAPWAVTDAPADYIDGMLRAIVGIEIALTQLTGKFKLSQNRSADDRAGVEADLQAQAEMSSRQLADWMRREGQP
jgi:transcriptional regulator